MKYTHVAILIHWLTALFIIGLLAIGKYMVGLDATDPLRFTLTQSHKTFGILVLALSVLRILWRLTHKAPPHPTGAPGWEKFCANASHLAFYALIFILPLSGWAMVSVSTLNIDTILFNRIELPHLPLIEWLGLADADAQKTWEHHFHEAHHVAGYVLIGLLVVHIGAALKHHFIDKDDVLNRMKPRWNDPAFWNVVAVPFIAVVIGFYAQNYLLNPDKGSNSGSLVAQSSSVSLQATVSGGTTDINFGTVNVVANLNLDDPGSSSLEATVDTGTVSSGNLQVEGSLPNSDWFDVANHPQATFVADSFALGQKLNTIDITGHLTVKGNSVPVNFTLAIEPATDTEPSKASTQFHVDRFALKLGESSQPDDTWVGNTVIVLVEFELSAGS